MIDTTNPFNLAQTLPRATAEETLSSASLHLSQTLAMGFGRQCRLWAAAFTDDLALQHAVDVAGQRLAAAWSTGSTAVNRRDLPDISDQAWLASGIVARADDDRHHLPIVIDHEALYLRRAFAAEWTIAKAMWQRAQRPARPSTPELQAVIEQLRALADDQSRAIAVALERSLLLLSGGPGVGKTRVMCDILAELLRFWPQLRISLAAPTGKASQRMQQSLAAAAERLPPSLSARLPRQASTLHRLLGIDRYGQCRHHRDFPLPVDLLVVDEASMLDLSLFTAMCQALPADAACIIIGDPNQLEAVESGVVFRELVAAAAASPDLAAVSVTLRHNYRFAKNAQLGEVAAAVLTGDAGKALALFQPVNDANASEVALAWYPMTSAWLDDRALAVLADGFQPFLSALEALSRVGEDDFDGRTTAIRNLLASQNQYSVLAALRQGGRGVDTLNQRLATYLNPSASPQIAAEQAYPGCPLLIRQNAADLGLANGDIGVVIAEKGQLLAYFARGDSELAWPIDQLPPWSYAYALTVHKAQGSEFERIALVLPQQDSRVLSRELVYTALTRARRQLVVIGEPQRLREALGRSGNRQSGLKARLAEVAARSTHHQGVASVYSGNA